MDETSSSITVASLPSVDGLLGTDSSRLVAYLSFPYRMEARKLKIPEPEAFSSIHDASGT